MAGKKFAILIGSSTFSEDESELQNLRCPPNDVEGLAKILRNSQLGDFDRVDELINDPYYRVLEQINRVLREATHEDLVLLYYSGHGKPNRLGRLHLATPETTISNLEATSVPIETIRAYIDGTLAQRVVLILDCCYSGKVEDAWLKSSISDQVEMTFEEGAGTYIITASSGYQTAQEKEGADYSVLTKPLIEGIKNGDADLDGNGWIDMDELYQYVRQEVEKVSPQTPMRWNFSGCGKIFIAKNPKYSKYSYKFTERKAADSLIQLLDVNNFNTLDKLARMLIILDDEKAIEPLIQLKERLIPHYPENYDESNYLLWQKIESWTEKKRQLFGPIEVQAQVWDKNGRPITAILTDENWILHIEWNLLSLAHRNIRGNWFLNVYLAPFGIGSEIMLNTEPIILPMNSSLDLPIYSKDIHLTPGAVSAGAYSIVITVTSQNEKGEPSPMAGFCQLPNIVFYDRTSYDTPEPFDIPMQVEIRGEFGQQANIISAQETWSISVEWRTPTLQKRIFGNWRISLFLSPLGPSSEIKLPQIPWIVPVKSELESATYAEKIMVASGSVPDGVYKVSVIVEHISEEEKTTNIAGFFEGQLLQFYSLSD